MTTRNDHDPFDLGFEADDDFTIAGASAMSDPWRGAPPERSSADDPFADFPPVRPGETGSAPFADLPPPAEPYTPKPPAVAPVEAAPAAPAVAPAATRMAPVEAAEPVAPVAHPVGTTQALVQEVLAAADADMGEAAVPRITIHAFCARPETVALVEAASADRRMARASTIAQPGGLEGAVAYYQNQSTPSLVLVESLDAAPRMLA
ncbi:MAG: pilus assembly protein CpaE, partial [Caulobacter sp.]|nr:pilus assembly protein CpaE [Caulobacter sp.]